MEECLWIVSGITVSLRTDCSTRCQYSLYHCHSIKAYNEVVSINTDEKTLCEHIEVPVFTVALFLHVFVFSLNSRLRN